MVRKTILLTTTCLKDLWLILNLHEDNFYCFTRISGYCKKLEALVILVFQMLAVGRRKVQPISRYYHDITLLAIVLKF